LYCIVLPEMLACTPPLTYMQIGYRFDFSGVETNRRESCRRKNETALPKLKKNNNLSLCDSVNFQMTYGQKQI